MFTGLIQKLGRLDRLSRGAAGARIAVRHAPWETELERGESVAVQGACLTVCEVAAGAFTCDVLDETLRRTNLGAARPGDALNLERALRMSDRLGGHMVLGHVDGVGTLAGVRREGRDWVLTISCPPELMADMAPKGSVACDGVSLTISRLAEDCFDVCLIPTTWEQTSLSLRRAGEAVNIESDIIGKYVRRFIRTPRGAAAELTVDTLIRAGLT